MAVFNSQSQIQIGGRWNPTLRRVERHFEGIMAGVVYNGLRPLDLAANSDSKTQVQGQVRLLENIPFDYRYFARIFLFTWSHQATFVIANEYLLPNFP